MIRALAKGALFGGFGITPATARLYRTLTREWMGSQATHVDKLQRAWPEYVNVWRANGVELDHADLWIHEGGWTPFPFFASHLVTGKAGVVTNHEGRMLDRYLARAVNGAIACELAADLPLGERRRDLEPMRWAESVGSAVSEIGGTLHEGVAVDAMPLADSSVDLCHTGGTLEHYRPGELAAFLRESMRILRPGGVMSHVFDHRDHLHHADAGWPYLYHYGMADVTYRLLCSGSLLYHNRLLPDRIAGMFEDAGFRRVKIRRMMLPSRKYVDDGTDMSGADFGIERNKLSRRFAEASDDDLRTAAAHYLYRKPT